jgi:hypothetical protein
MGKRKILGPGGHERLRRAKLARRVADAEAWKSRPRARQFYELSSAGTIQRFSADRASARKKIAEREKKAGRPYAYPAVLGAGSMTDLRGDDVIMKKLMYVGGDMFTTEAGAERRVRFAEDAYDNRRALQKDWQLEERKDADWEKRLALRKGMLSNVTPGSKQRREKAFRVMDELLATRPADDDFRSRVVNNFELFSPDRRKPGRVRYQLSADERTARVIFPPEPPPVPAPRYRRQWLGRKIATISPSELKRGQYGPWPEE